MNTVDESIWNPPGTRAAAISPARLRRSVVAMQFAAAVLMLTGGADRALADVNSGGLSICNPNEAYGTSIGYASSRTPTTTTGSVVHCLNSQYSFFLGNGVGTTGSGTGDTTASITGNAAGQLRLFGKQEISLQGLVNLNGNKITNLADGTAATDAVNVRQLNAAIGKATGSEYVKVNAGAGTNAGAATATNTGSVAIGGGASADAGGASSASGGGVAIGQGAKAIRSSVAMGANASAQSAAGQNTALALGTGSAANGDGAVSLGGLARATGAGAVAVGGRAASAAANGTAIGNRASVTSTGTNSVALGNGSVATVANVVSVGSTAANGQRRIVNLAQGTAATDAVNVGQMDARLDTKLGNQYAKVGGTTAAAADNSGRAGNIAIGANARSNAGINNSSSIALGENADASGAGSVAVGNAAIASGSGAAAFGARAKATGTSSVALGLDSVADRADTVSVGTAAHRRQITNLAAGTADNDATNLAQLKANAQATASALGGGSTVLSNGSLTAPTYAFRSRSFNNVGDALFNLDGRVGDLEVGGGGGAGLVTFNDALGRVEVARAKGGNEVNFAADNGASRRLKGVQNGMADDEAVTVAQLKAAGAFDPTNGSFLGAIMYDDQSLSKVTLGGNTTTGTVIGNLGNGQVAAGSMQAINGGQLFQALGNAASLLGGEASVGLQGVFVAPSYQIQNSVYHDVGSALSALDGKVSELDRRTMASASGGAGMGMFSMQDDSRIEYATAPIEPTAAAPAPAAAPVESGVATVTPVGTTLGEGAVASGIGSAAIGDNAIASADSSVALGSGSVADRVNSVSVGSVGNERQITNVAEGTADTDAVNKAQLDRGVASANTYTDSKISSINDSFDVFKGEVDGRLQHMDRRIDRQGAMSAAMLNMATSAAGVKTDNRVGVGVGFQGGESALSLGYQRAISERATVTVGGAFSGDDASVGFGAGFGW